MVQRWNWSPRAGKWVYVDIKNGKKVYKYQKDTPKQYGELIKQLKDLNDKLLNENDPDINNAIYKKMIDVSQKLQEIKA